MCTRSRSNGFELWGSDECPSDTVTSGGASAYGGYVMTDQSYYHGSSFMCVEKDSTTIARNKCEPAEACPAANGALTAFHFDTTITGEGNDFVGSGVGGTSGPGGGGNRRGKRKLSGGDVSHRAF